MIKEGDVGTEFFIVLSGQVEILKSKEVMGQMTDESMGVINQNGSFGELALFDDNLRAVSIMTREPSFMMVLNKKDFQESIARGAMQNNNKIIEFFQNTSVCQQMSHDDLNKLASMVKPV